MLCVCLAVFSRDFGILCTLFSFHCICCVFLYSFKFLCLLEYLNILLIGIFFRDIVYENPFLSMCWVDIDISVLFGLLYLRL
jgi:hypothetical protein